MRKRLLLSTFTALILCACLLCVSASPVSAASSYSRAASGTVTVDAGRSVKIPFKISSKKYVMVYGYADSALEDEEAEKGDLELKIKKNSGKTLKKVTHNWEDFTYLSGDEIYGFTKKKVPKGQYYFTLKNTTNLPLKVEYQVRTYKKPAPKAGMKKKAALKRDDWVVIGRLKGGLPVVKSIKSSDKKIIDEFDIDQNGDIWAYAKKTGTVSIQTTLKNGKKYKTKVTVKPPLPDVYAYLCDYDTRDNYFTVKIKNNGTKTITVIRKGGWVENVDYKSFDRDFKSSGDVKIKPGKTKYVRFYCKGNPTWYDYKDYTLCAKIKSEGKTYTWHVWDTQSVFKIGKKWKNSYKDADEYDEWG